MFKTRRVRRQFLSLFGGLFTLPLLWDSLSSFAFGKPRDLRASGNTACLRLALELSNLPVATKSYNLHLRNASLTLRDVKLIASAMCKGEDISGPSLLSLSMSHNFNITDIGVQALVSVLPDTITDIGFVGCGLSDKAGLALLRWARISENLQLICIEENNFSQALKNEFNSLSKKKLPLSVVI